MSGVYNSYRIPGRLWRGSDASTSTESGSDVSTIPENHFSFGIGNEGNAVKGDEPDCSLKIPVSPAIDEKSKMKLGKLDTSTITTITTHISDTWITLGLLKWLILWRARANFRPPPLLLLPQRAVI